MKDEDALLDLADDYDDLMSRVDALLDLTDEFDKALKKSFLSEVD